ncbi:KIN14B-interacting protein At4g14310-like [Apium graveolens]|uniref:KIN14B-interacting protein At4g14310-like n=1 Tax=Apium graveolens TaxID=4045 RepID=UPI003D7B0654
MSTLSLRRNQDRGGGGGTAAKPITTASKPTKPITPISKESIKNVGSGSIKTSSGKENPRPSSRIRAASAAVKPVIRPVPRIDKAYANSDLRLRRAVSRGRSSSPCEFNTGLSKFRVLDGGSSKVLDKGRDCNEIRRRGLKESKSLAENDVGLEKSNDPGKVSGLKLKEKEVLIERKEPRSLERNVVGMEKSSEPGKDLGSKLKKRESLSNRGLENCKVGSGGVRARGESRGRASVCLRSNEVAENGVKEIRRNSLSRTSGLDVPKGKCGSEEAMTVSATKYPSKLHEKLAFLEGKVKRIATDIKRTKEILDSNNTDASKVIITDIQEKISGIEKVMGRVTVAEPKTAVDHAGENIQQINAAETSVKISAKGLNTEELEARLFPHHKLLRDRTSLKQSVGGGLSRSSQIGEPKVEETMSVSNLEAKLSSPIDEKPIVVEFLASLKGEQSRNTIKGDYSAVQEMDGAGNSKAYNSSNIVIGEQSAELKLTTSGTLDEFDDQENLPAMIIDEETENNCIYQLNMIGHKSTAGGWFVSDGESVLLAHGDSSCTFYDISHCEEKAEYRPPVGIPPNIWRDCWIVRAPNADGCSGKFVVAASAGNTMESGFCSWDFYSKEVKAINIEDGRVNTRTALAPLPNNTFCRRNSLSSYMAPDNQQWWYKPSGPLMVSTAGHQRVVKLYDIRDGEHIMKWEVQKPVLAMDYSSPVQWRNRGKIVIAEAENISLWDVNSQNPQSLVSVSSLGRKISALHVNNTDAEMGGGVRQRVSSSEAEGNDGVFCTSDSINIIDFRHPIGVGFKIPKLATSAQSVFSRGDSIYIGCTNLMSSVKKQSSSQIQQFSMRKQSLVGTYALPDSKAQNTTITQVWGNSNFVMGVCGLGLFAFDAFDDQMQSSTSDYASEVIGPDDLYSPSFDYLGSRVLLISRDRPAMWKYMS